MQFTQTSFSPFFLLNFKQRTQQVSFFTFALLYLYIFKEQ